MADTVFVMSPSPGFFHIQSQQKVQSLPVAKTSLHVPVFVQPLSKTRRSIPPMPMFDPTFYGGFGPAAEITTQPRPPSLLGHKRTAIAQGEAVGICTKSGRLLSISASHASIIS
jgi:hypothetical protein